MNDTQGNTTTKTDLAVSGVLARIAEGKITSFGQLVKEVAPPPEAPKVDKAPLPALITDDEKKALAELPEVYGSVVPTQPRTLEPAEVTSLLAERTTLKTVEKMVERRLADISLTVLNHPDEGFDPSDTEGVMLDADGNPMRNAKGHIVRKVKVRGDGTQPDCFSVETRSGSANVSPERLLALADDPEVDYIYHKDFLSMTRPTRVFDKAMLALRTKPSLLRAVREASSTSTPVVAVYQRADKQ